MRRALRVARVKVFGRPGSRPRAGFRPTIEGVEERVLLSILPRGFAQSVVVRGLIEPSGLVAVPDGRIFVIQQTGQVRVIQNGRLLPQPLLSLNTDSSVERGLVGITIDPSFLTNRNTSAEFRNHETPETWRPIGPVDCEDGSFG